MKYVLAALVAVAGFVAVFVRPPSIGSIPPKPPPAGVSSLPSPGARPARPSSPAPSLAGIVVYVAGAVRRPGVYRLPLSARGIDALARAGGAKDDADLVAVNLAAPLADGDELAVPVQGAASASRGSRAHSSHASPRARHRHRQNDRAPHSRRPAQAALAADVPGIDLNTADAVRLESVPGVGPALAARIVQYRTVNGRFGSLDELNDVSGVSSRVADTLSRYTFVR